MLQFLVAVIKIIFYENKIKKIKKYLESGHKQMKNLVY